MPVSAGAAILQTGLGIYQAFHGAKQEKNAGKQLDALVKNQPKYAQNKGIMDYYGQALARYNVSPTSSALYKRQQSNITRGVATGIGALQDRRAGQAGISSIMRGAADAGLNAEVAAENQQNQRFGVLGQATGMKAADERYAYQENQKNPFEMKYNLLSQKAGGGAAKVNAGITNAFGGLQNFTDMKMADKIYGTGKSPKTGGTGDGIGFNTFYQNQRKKTGKF